MEPPERWWNGLRRPDLVVESRFTGKVFGVVATETELASRSSLEDNSTEGEVISSSLIEVNIVELSSFLFVVSTLALEKSAMETSSLRASSVETLGK